MLTIERIEKSAWQSCQEMLLVKLVVVDKGSLESWDDRKLGVLGAEHYCFWKMKVTLKVNLMSSMQSEFDFQCCEIYCPFELGPVG